VQRVRVTNYAAALRPLAGTLLAGAAAAPLVGAWAMVLARAPEQVGLLRVFGAGASALTATGVFAGLADSTRRAVIALEFTQATIAVRTTTRTHRFRRAEVVYWLYTPETGRFEIAFLDRGRFVIRMGEEEFGRVSEMLPPETDYAARDTQYG
jgi:hypothetical protein